MNTSTQAQVIPGPGPSSPLRAGVSSAGGALEVMVRVQAPAQPAGDAATPRPPLRLALVVDRSGSMDGAPLREALRCVNHLVGCLQRTDAVAVVLYDHDVQVPVPLQPAALPDAIRAALAGVQSGGNTALFDGWQAGAQQLEAGQAGAVSRVLLLSDGQANHGLTEVAPIEKHCAEWLAKGISTTTVGLGRHFNEELMVAMARAGGGQNYYGETAEDLFDGFAEELALLEALHLRQLHIKLVPAPGVIAEPLGLVQPDADGLVRLPDLAWGAEAWLMVRLHLPTQAVGATATLLGVTLQAQDKEAHAVSLAAAPLSLPVLDATACAALPVDEAVASRLKEVEFAMASARARAMVQEGNIKAARAHLQLMETSFASHPWLSGKLDRLRALLDRDERLAAKEMLYASQKLSTRLARTQEAAYNDDETHAQDVPAFLRRKAEEGQGRKT
jgi:Ca-activated chloride channel family protein